MNDNFDNNENSSDSIINDTVSGVENVTKKKKGGKIAAIAIGAVVVIAGGSIAAYNLSDYVKNKVKLATLEPEEYYSWVTEKNATEAADSVSKTYQKYIDALSDGQTANASFRYDVSDDAKKELLSMLMGSDYENSATDETQQYIDIINNINSIEIGANSSVKSSIMNGGIYASVNDEKLVTADLSMNYDELAYYFRIPELSEKWLGISLENLAEESSNALIESDITAMKDFMSNPEEYLSPEELDELINKYSAVWCSEIDDVELEKKEKVDIGDITVEYTVLTSEIDGKKACDIAEAFIDEASDDKLLKEIVTERLAVCTEDEYDSALSSAAENIKENKDSNSFDDQSIELITYVDAKGTIRGISFNTPDDTYKYDYIIGLENDNVYGTLSFTDGSDIINAELNAIKDGNKYNGDIDVKYSSEDSTDEYSFSIEFNDFEVVDEEKGYVNCGLTVIIPDVDPIALDFSSDGKSQDITFELNIDDTDYGKFTFNMSNDKSGDIEQPDVSNAILIDPENSDFDIESYVTEEEVTSFIKELLTKIGFSEEDAQAVAETYAANMFYSYDDLDYNYDDYYTYDDTDDYDYDYDYDDEDENPDYANAVSAESGQAYINIMDYYWDAEYWGDAEDSLSYKAGVASINGNGTYTVNVTADTDGYRYATTGDVSDASVLPSGIDYLSVCIEDGTELFPNAVINIDSVKIDGSDVQLTGKNFTTDESYETEAVIYCDWYGDTPTDARCADGNAADTSAMIIDGSSIKNWTNLEITFTVSGIQ